MKIWGVIFLLSLVSLSAEVFANTPDYHFVVDPLQSYADITITVMDLPSSDRTALSGWIEGDANPNFAPFGNINITGLKIEATETLSFDWYMMFVLDGYATVSDYGMTMTEHGPETTVISGAFSQPNNFVRNDGMIDYYFDSLLLPAPLDDVMYLEDSEPTEQVIPGRISQTGGAITLQQDIFYEETSIMDGIEVTVQISGRVVAQAPAKWVDEDFDDSLTVDVFDLEIMADEWLCRDLFSDLDDSGFVDLHDFARLTDYSEFVTLASEWLQPSQVLWADTNQDRVTNLADLAQLGSYWLQSAPW